MFPGGCTTPGLGTRVAISAPSIFNPRLTWHAQRSLFEKAVMYTVPAKDPKREFNVGHKIRVNLHLGKIEDAVVRAVTQHTDSIKLQVDVGLPLFRHKCEPSSTEPRRKSCEVGEGKAELPSVGRWGVAVFDAPGPAASIPALEKMTELSVSPLREGPVKCRVCVSRFT